MDKEKSTDNDATLQFLSERQNRIDAYAKNNELKDKAHQFSTSAIQNQYSYNFNWLGRPIIQYPQDIVAVQELIWEVKPDLIIEAGIAHGGSIILSASILALLDLSDAIDAGEQLDYSGKLRKVVGLDIDIRQHNREAIIQHPMSRWIEMIEASSIAAETIKQVEDIAKGYSKVLVLLDSNHTHDHVMAELKAYAKLTRVGSYCVVFDGIIEDLPAETYPDRPWAPGNNPKTAVWKFIEQNPNFQIDENFNNKLLITVAPVGYLKRIS
jgi:cephalosporin hydroxylase